MIQRNLAELSLDYENSSLHGLNVKRVVQPATRSPLRYPGGKSRAVKTLRKYIPNNLTSICSPFIGGASLELVLAAEGIKVYGSDAFSPVIIFWQKAIEDAVLLSERVSELHPLSKPKFYALQKTYNTLKTDFERAAVFFVLNRSSFSGTTLSGGMSPKHPRFNSSAIKRLRDFHASNLFVEIMDYKDALDTHKHEFLYLDPPYANGSKLYGKKGDMHENFDHEQFAKTIRKREGWLLSYNDSSFVRDLYKGYRFVMPEWAYGMNGSKRSNEVLIIG